MDAKAAFRRYDAPQSPEDAYFTAVRNGARKHGLHCTLLEPGIACVGTHNPEDLYAVQDGYWLVSVSGDLHPAETLSSAVGFILERHYGWSYHQN